MHAPGTATECGLDKTRPVEWSGPSCLPVRIPVDGCGPLGPVFRGFLLLRVRGSHFAPSFFGGRMPGAGWLGVDDVVVAGDGFPGIYYSSAASDRDGCDPSAAARRHVGEQFLLADGGDPFGRAGERD